MPRSEIVVGREPGLAVTIPVDGVSRRHARITFDGKSYSIENLSPAGTFLNGALVVQERLAHLDVITLGRNVDLLFLLRAENEGTSTMEGIVRAALVPETADAVPYEIAPGEILLGRSSANNVVAEAKGAVSKIHARVERSPQQLILRDLGSSNGTFVNGERVMTALLRDGDVIALANVVQYRVIVERGRVAASTIIGAPAIEVPVPEADTRGEFSPEWKTRYDWDSGEIKDIAALQARLIAEDGERKRAKAKKEAPPAAKTAPRAPVKPAASAKPAAAAKVPVLATAPAAPPSDAAATGQAVDATVGRAAADALAAHDAPVAVAVPAAIPTAVPVVAPAVAPIAVPVAAPAERPVAEIRLTGPAGDLVVTEPGEYELGRSRDARLRVDNPTVSRRHALVVLTPDRQALVDDGGGANGTRLNGALVTKRSLLANGDRISVGEVELLVRLKPRDPP